MEFENLLTLIKTVSDSELTDFDYEENGTRIRLKKKKETVWDLKTFGQLKMLQR